MNTRARPQPENTQPWQEAVETPVEGYHEALAAAIAKGRAELDDGQGIPLEEVEKEFGLE